MAPVPESAPIRTRFGGMALLQVAVLAGVAWIALSRHYLEYTASAWKVNQLLF